MPKLRTLEEMCHDNYDDDELCNAVINSAIGSGNKEKIESGELVLPGYQDAKHWHDRETGRINESAIEKDQRKRIELLEKSLDDLKNSYETPNPEYIEKMRELIKQSNR